MIPDSLRKYVYYEEPNIVLLHGDASNLWPEIEALRVDCVITDPPYGIGEPSGTVGKARSNKHEYNRFDDTPEYIEHVVWPLISKCIVKFERVALTPGPKCMCSYKNPDSFGAFYQPATVGMQKWGRADAQPIFYYGRDPRVGKTIKSCSCVLTEPPSDKEHPCAKPMEAWKWLVDKCSMESDTILDPFLGSGTTAVAAKQLGRKCIGIELSKEYLDIAVKRLRQEVLF